MCFENHAKKEMSHLCYHLSTEPHATELRHPDLQLHNLIFEQTVSENIMLVLIRRQLPPPAPPARKCAFTHMQTHYTLYQVLHHQFIRDMFLYLSFLFLDRNASFFTLFLSLFLYVGSAFKSTQRNHTSKKTNA